MCKSTTLHMETLLWTGEAYLNGMCPRLLLIQLLHWLASVREGLESQTESGCDEYTLPSGNPDPSTSSTLDGGTRFKLEEIPGTSLLHRPGCARWGVCSSNSLFKPTTHLSLDWQLILSTSSCRRTRQRAKTVSAMETVRQCFGGSDRCNKMPESCSRLFSPPPTSLETVRAHRLPSAC